MVLRLWVLGGLQVLVAVPAPPCAQDSQYVVAVRNYSPGDGDQLSFHKGDIIHLQPLEHPERGERPPQPAVVKCPQWGAQRWRD